MSDPIPGQTPDKETEQLVSDTPEGSEAPIIGDAERNEAEPRVTDEQLEHFQKQSEVKARTSPEHDAREAFYHIIKKDFAFNSEIKRELAKGLLAALKISKTQDRNEYLLTVVKLASELRGNPKMNERTGAEFIAQNAMVAATTFPELDEAGRQEIESYLEGMVEKIVEQSLEEYLKGKFGLESQDNWNPDDKDDPRDKEVMTTLAMMNASNLEDFTIKVPEGQEKNSDEIRSNIRSYYESNGYEIRDEYDELVIKKGDEELLITMSNFGHNIMISVCPM